MECEQLKVVHCKQNGTIVTDIGTKLYFDITYEYSTINLQLSKTKTKKAPV